MLRLTNAKLIAPSTEKPRSPNAEWNKDEVNLTSANAQKFGDQYQRSQTMQQIDRRLYLPFIARLTAAVFLFVFALISYASELDIPIGSKTGSILAKIVINNKNIFSDPDRPGRKLLNRTHIVTRKHVIRREVWMRSGEIVTSADLRELERNLRDLGLFASVEVSTQPSATTPDTVDLIINTEDKFSFLGVAGATFLGGIGEAGFLLNENNLLGLGHQLQYRYVENTDGNKNGTLSYRNILVSGKDIYAGFSVGQTEVGKLVSFDLENRFQNFDDPLSWKLELKRESSNQDYFDEGELVAVVPRTSQELSVSRTIRNGTRESSWRMGPVFRFDRTDYRSAQGSQADTITVPENDERFYGGVLLGRERTFEYREVTGVDTLGFTQDLSIGYQFELLAGLSYNTSLSEKKTTPVVFFNTSKNNSVSDFNYINLGVDGSFTFDKKDLQNWNISPKMTWFNTRFDRQTLAARIKYSSSYTRSGLPAQQLLGEDNGLRGYPAREFDGEQMLLLNLEHRFIASPNFAGFEIGTVTFFDAGWVGERGNNGWLNSPHTSAGVGLRIGSPQFLGSSIIRLDYAHPLDNSNSKEYEPTVSLAVGQVFGFNP